MELTNKFIEEHGFTKVNNSMWRKGNVTIQNDWITEGDTAYERLFGYKKAYNICLSGKYMQHITTVTDFKVFVCGLFDDACESKCNKHAVMPSCLTCYYSGNGKHSCDRHMNKLKPDYSKGVECYYNNYAHYRAFRHEA